MGVKKKVFISSVGAIVVGFIILYLTLYIFMPQVYKTYKFNALEKKVNQFVSELEKDSYNDIDQVLDKFTYENNVMIGIKDYSGKIIYSSFRQGFIKPNNIMKMDGKRDNINPFNIVSSLNSLIRSVLLVYIQPQG